MVTIFDLLTILLPAFGIGLGASFGSEFGTLGAIGGALIGGVAGFYIGRLPVTLITQREHRKLARFSPAELRAQLRDQNCLTPNLVLLELRSRGENINSELPIILDLMQSEHQHYRTRGFAALLSAFPSVTKLTKGYNPMHSSEECRQKVSEIKEKAEQAP